MMDFQAYDRDLAKQVKLEAIAVLSNSSGNVILSLALLRISV